MILKSSRIFNTSGPCMIKRHYTLIRQTLLNRGTDLVNEERYFTIWAPRQTGKSTFFRLLKTELENLDYQVVHINVENFLNASESFLLDYIDKDMQLQCKMPLHSRSFEAFTTEIKSTTEHKLVLIIDEIEGLNPDIFNQFLHTIRNLYHSRDMHSLKSVIFVGVSNILGIIQDNASPFNIADNLAMPYFSREEVFELLAQHETETGQLFSPAVKDKLFDITQGQPGLVNGFAYQLVDRWPEKEIIEMPEYYEVEDWYLYEAIDKNIENIVNKAKQYRNLVEDLLFREKEIRFDTTMPSIRFLHTQGVIQKGANNNIEFWVPLYKKKLYKAFSPDYNGEGNYFFTEKDQTEYLENNTLNLNDLIQNFLVYVQQRSLKHFMKRSEDGHYYGLKEAAAGYAFSTYIDQYIKSMRGTIYYEADSGLGRTDMIINILDKEYILEFKMFTDRMRFNEGKEQVAYYARTRMLTEAFYVVFAATRDKNRPFLVNSTESIKDITVYTHVIWYDEEKDFG